MTNNAPERIFAWVYEKGSRRYHRWRGKVGPGGDGQTQYIRADQAQAELQSAVAAEREACAEELEERAAWRSIISPVCEAEALRCASRIRARTTADAQAALEKVKREARNEALREAAIEAEDVAQARLGDERETARACRDHILELMKDTDDE